MDPEIRGTIGPVKCSVILTVVLPSFSGLSNNVADQHPELVSQLTALMEQYIAEGRSTPGAAQANDTETLLYQ